MAKKKITPSSGDLFDPQELKSFIRFFDDSGLTELKLRSADRSLQLSKLNSSFSAPASQQPIQVHAAQPAAHAPAAPAPAAAAPVPNPGEKFLEITSPIVGTFYRSPSPEAKLFVEVGDEVSAGKVVCIVEAMKIMNEIESEVAGIIQEICVENEQPVEYGQVLFRVKPKS